MDWELGNKPPMGAAAEFAVWLADGSLRRVRADQTCCMWRFTDCTHPAQNVFCHRDRIAAWKMLPPSLPADTQG